MRFTKAMVETLLFAMSVSNVHAAQKVAEPQTLPQYLATVEDISKVRFYESDELDPDTLCSRAEDGVIVIERLEGVCKDSAGNGRIINAYYEENNYISYSHAMDAETGAKIRKGQHVDTYCVYDDSDSEDGVEYRFDYIVK